MIKQLCLALALAFGILPSQTGWRAFHSPTYRFGTYYPPGWQPLSRQSDGYTAINFPQSERVEGIIVPRDGAMIEVGPTGEPNAQRQIAADLRNAGAEPTVDQELVTNLPYADACGTLRQLDYDVNLGSTSTPVYQHITSFFCAVHGRSFAVTLIYFQGNKDSTKLKSIALTIARLLRIEK